MTLATGKFLVVAASCRSLVRSIRLAGYQCAGIDLFADADTIRYCPVRRVRNPDAAVGEVANFASDFQVVIGSGIENRILGQTDPFTGRLVCGISGDALCKARDPFLLAARIRESGFSALEVRTELPARGNWIRKSVRSGGGRGVKLFRDSDSRRSTRPVEEHYYQQYLRGPVFGASFVASGNRCHLLGVCRQHTGQLSPNEFVYLGSSGPIQMPCTLTALLETMGHVVTRISGLSGLFGIDFVLRKGEPMLLEVNPRYTASMEILERVWQQSLFHQHLTGIHSEPPGWWPGIVGKPPIQLAKRYVYWREPWPVLVNAESHDRLMALAESNAEFATDIPHAETVIESYSPVCTVWARHEKEAAAVAKTVHLEREILAMLKQGTAAAVATAVR